MEMILVNFSEIKSVQYFTSHAKVPLIVLSQKVLRCIDGKELHARCIMDTRVPSVCVECDAWILWAVLTVNELRNATRESCFSLFKCLLFIFKHL